MCRSLQATVLDPYLQYMASLDVAGMRDGRAGGAALPVRSKALADYEATWKTGQVPMRSHDIPGQEYYLHNWIGGVFVRLPDPAEDQARIVIHRPASFFSGINEKTWAIDLSSFVHGTEGVESSENIVAYAVDVEQALTAVLLAPKENQ